MGIITQRRKQRQAARLRNHLIRLIALVGVIASLAFSPAIREGILGAARNIQAFSQSAQMEMTLPEYDVYALQLAVFDSGERAASELGRLQAQGVYCVIWQQNRMRIVADAAIDRGKLNTDASKGNDAYVIQDTMEKVHLRLSADTVSVSLAKRLLEAPDALFRAIANGDETMERIAQRAQTLADEALQMNLGNDLYAQLAKGLSSWSQAMKKTLETADESDARSYGAVTMCTLCRELRQALSALSMASAQRTPSTAADVMPPA